MGEIQRRHFTATQKLAIVRRHLIDQNSVANLCDEHDLKPTQFYQWQKQLFENGEAAFERKSKPADLDIQAPTLRTPPDFVGNVRSGLASM
jgi:transposase-like protein